MTESEALKFFKNFIDIMKINGEEQVLKNDYCKASNIAIKAIEENQQYKSLGTVEELRIAKEKQIAKKPIIQKTDEKSLYKCPCCKNIFVEAYENMQRGYIPKFCEMCGQSISFRMEG